MQKTNKQLNKQQGQVTIFVSMVTLTLILFIGLGISSILTSQIKMTSEASQSVVAFYAAEAGAERCLYEVRKVKTPGFTPCLLVSFTNVPVGEAIYTVNYAVTPDGIVRTIRSTGTYLKTNRAVEIEWEE